MEAAHHARHDRVPVLAFRFTRARALARVREERAAVSADQTVGAVVVLLDREAALLRVDRPSVGLSAGAVIVRHHRKRPELLTVAVAVVAIGGEACGRKHKSGREQPRDDPTLLHQSS